MNQTTALTGEEQELLWQKIASFPFDTPDAPLPFSRRLAGENKWDYHFTLKAIEEYRKFIFLCCISPQGASPSKVIDEVWHLHLIYTKSYWEEFCGKTLNRDIHHHPSAGGPQERDKHKTWRADTLDLYRNTFHAEPPPECWDDKHSPTNILLRFLKRISPLLLLFPFLAACNETSAGFVPFIVGFMIIIGSILTGSQGNKTGEKRKKNESDGSSCGSSCGSGCGSGCGGGCGGCGG